MDVVEASELFCKLATENPSVESWPDSDAPDGDWEYFSIVSRFGEGNVRILVYVRVHGNLLQKRTYDAAGDDLWVTAE